jgi:hypothetical protein
MTAPIVSAALLLEEDLVQLEIVVLPGVDDAVVGVSIERRHHPRQADDLGTGSDDRGDLHVPGMTGVM